MSVLIPMLEWTMSDEEHCCGAVVRWRKSADRVEAALLLRHVRALFQNAHTNAICAQVNQVSIPIIAKGVGSRRNTRSRLIVHTSNSTQLSHTRIRFHSCTGTQSRIVLSPLPRLIIIIRIHTPTGGLGEDEHTVMSVSVSPRHGPCSC